MPNTKSAIRRVRRVKKQTSVNRTRKGRYKSALKKMDAFLNSKSEEVLFFDNGKKASGPILVNT